MKTLSLKVFKSSDIVAKLKCSISDTVESILKSNMGFMKLMTDDMNWTESEKLGQFIRQNYDHLVVVGIGGSSMGPRALAELSTDENISFLDNVDSVETENILKKIFDLPSKKIAWLFISKSGTTIEVLWTMELIVQRYKELHKDFWPHTFYITEYSHNPLHELSIKHKRPCLEIPLAVGGRFSVLSPVGLVIASFLKMSVADIRQGARLAMNDLETLEILIEQFFSSFERQEDITLFWFYCSRLRWFGGWLEQLWAESLGKKEDRQGKPAFVFSTPATSIGACDQHSILQQVIEGPKNKFVCIFRFKDLETNSAVIKEPIFKETRFMQGKKFGDLLKAEALATQKALDMSEVSTLLFEFEKLTPETLGYLFMQFQIVVAVMAEIKNINAFDQPAVALGKKLIRDYL